jgi:hypothetical protein
LVPTRKIADLDISAASGLVVQDGRAWVVADDELALHAYDLGGRPVERIPLFAGDLPIEAGPRKRRKPDIESLFALEPRWLCALGSGSGPSRRRGATLSLDGPRAVRPIDLDPLYRALAREVRALNVEGAAPSGNRLRLFHRGEGVIFDLDLDGFAAAVGGDRPPDGTLLCAVHHVELGSLGGVPLGFTDASPLGDGRIVFAAAAEDTDDPVRDGPVTGCAVGLLDPEGRVLAIETLEAPAKVEGVHATPTASRDTVELLLVCDADDRRRPASLLAARWRAAGR